MKVYNCEQGTDEWTACRLGIPTASSFDKILTPTGKPSSSALAYRRTLIAERATQQPEGIQQTEWMARGNELESGARALYAVEYNEVVEQVGFVLSDHGYGCSPDGLIGSAGMLEIKAPKPSTHVGYVLDGKLPTKYKPQIQGQLLVCEREWVDFMSYLPSARPFIIRASRDDEYIKLLHQSLCEFIEMLEAEDAEYKERSGA